jgi:16S rRNA (cytosine967-C5)-methyltransferase
MPSPLRAGDLARTPWARGAPALASAAKVVDAVLTRGQSADAALACAGTSSERAAVRAIALGTIRWYLRILPAIEALLERPSDVPALVRALLAAAAHQVEYSRHAPEATVHAAVDAARLLKVPRSTGLVNAVLRRFVAERATLFARLEASLPVRTAHPAWLAERIRAAWPTGEAVLAANNEHPPMTLRVDLSRLSAADCVARLAAASIDSREIQWVQSAIVLNHPTGVNELPGFAEGWVSVQDAGAQVAAGLLHARPGMRVLDACAAPGGKTAHLLELLGDGAQVTALDIDTARMELIAENLKRLGRTAHLVVGDAREPATFWDGRPFERILVDAPCSSTGVIRRHPDIKLLRRPGDIPVFAATQLAILRAAVGLLAPGGRLVYSTCSVLPEENEQVVAALLTAEPGITLAGSRELSFVPGAVARAAGTQLLPGSEAGTDGFYYACLEKTTTGT